VRKKQRHSVGVRQTLSREHLSSAFRLSWPVRDELRDSFRQQNVWYRRAFTFQLFRNTDLAWRSTPRSYKSFAAVLKTSVCSFSPSFGYGFFSVKEESFESFSVRITTLVSGSTRSKIVLRDCRLRRRGKVKKRDYFQ